MPSPSVRYHAGARSDVEGAFEWYLLRSAQAADAFLRELDRAARLITEAPAIWPRYERETRRYVLRNFPFDVVYR